MIFREPSAPSRSLANSSMADTSSAISQNSYSCRPYECISSADWLRCGSLGFVFGHGDVSWAGFHRRQFQIEWELLEASRRSPEERFRFPTQSQVSDTVPSGGSMSPGDGGEGGLVHVRTYVRTVNGKSVSVSAHTRRDHREGSTMISVPLWQRTAKRSAPSPSLPQGARHATHSLCVIRWSAVPWLCQESGGRDG